MCVLLILTIILYVPLHKITIYIALNIPQIAGSFIDKLQYVLAVSESAWSSLLSEIDNELMRMLCTHVYLIHA